MSKEQGVRFAASDLCLLSIDAPDASGDVVHRSSIPGDVVLLACYALGSLRGPERETLRVWIEDEAIKGSSWRCESLPPPTILKFPDLLEKLWGWDRLIAYDLDCDFEDPSDMLIYESYLEKFYGSNDQYQNNAADVILKCLEKEKALSSEWKAKRIQRVPFNTDLSTNIQEYMSDLVNDAGSELRHPVVTYAAACITKEAELMIEWLRQGSHVPEEEYNTSTEIRELALDLAMFKGDWSVHTAAVLLGITKEAGPLLESASRGCLVSTDISMRIRSYGLDFLIFKLGEFESDAKLTPELSDEMTSTVEVNQLTGCNTENVSFGKIEMQEQCVSKNIIDAKNRPENITGEQYPVIVLNRPQDEEAAY